MPCYTVREIELLKRRCQPVTVRSLTMSGKTNLLRKKKAYSAVLGISIDELVRQINEVPPELVKEFRRKLRVGMKNMASQL